MVFSIMSSLPKMSRTSGTMLGSRRLVSGEPACGAAGVEKGPSDCRCAAHMASKYQGFIIPQARLSWPSMDQRAPMRR